MGNGSESLNRGVCARVASPTGFTVGSGFHSAGLQSFEVDTSRAADVLPRVRSRQLRCGREIGLQVPRAWRPRNPCSSLSRLDGDALLMRPYHTQPTST